MIKVLVAGDYCPEGFLVKEALYYDKRIAETASMIADITAQHDISVINVETVYSKYDIPIPKSGPNLKSSVKTLDFLKQMHFTVAACANNHIGDYGEAGVLDTLEHLKRIGMQTVGAGENIQAAREICYIKKKDMTVALINCCEHEFGIAGRDKAGSAVMDVDILAGQITEAKGKADAVLVYIHGGNEYNPLPRPGMKKLCYRLAECGAAAIIVGHSHCPQGIEKYKGVPIAYGIGNFYFPRAESEGMWNNGYLVSLSIDKNTEVDMEIIPYVQMEDGAGIRLLEGQKKQAFMEYMDCISDLMNRETIYEKLTLAWCSMYMRQWGRDYLKNGPTENRNDLETLIIRNLFTCESHNELIKTYYHAFCEGMIEEKLEVYCDIMKRLQQGRVVAI